MEIEPQKLKWIIKPRQWKHKETGEVTTTINIMEMDKYEEVTEDEPGYTEIT